MTRLGDFALWVGLRRWLVNMHPTAARVNPPSAKKIGFRFKKLKPNIHSPRVEVKVSLGFH
jgi:hypothetical protein